MGARRFGTGFGYRDDGGRLAREKLPVALAANAASLGARAVNVIGIDELRAALGEG